MMTKWYCRDGASRGGRPVARSNRAGRRGLIVLLLCLCSYMALARGALAMPAAADAKKPLPRLVMQTGHSKYVAAAAFSPDGRTLASGSDDKTIKLWDVATGRELRTLSGHSRTVSSLAFAPDGQTLVSGSADATLKIWEVATGRELRTLSGHELFVTGVAFSPDGKTVVSGSRDGSLKVWDAATGRELRACTGHGNPVSSVAFSPDGSRVISGSWDKTVKLWDVATGQELRSFAGHANWVTSVAFSPDGRSVVSGSRDRFVRLWDAGSGQELRSIELEEEARSVNFSPDGKTVASVNERSSEKMRAVRLWEVATGRELPSVAVPRGSVITMAGFSPDGRSLIAGCFDGRLHLWDLDTGLLSRSFAGLGRAVKSVAYSRDGKTIALGSDGSGNEPLKLWDLLAGRQLPSLVGHVNTVSGVHFSPDSKILLSVGNDSSIKSWDVASGAELPAIDMEAHHTSSLHGAALSPDGRTLASTGRSLASGDNESKSVIQLWDTGSGRLLHTLTGHGSYADDFVAVAFSPDGRTLASGSNDTTIELWDVASGKELRILTGHTSTVNCVAFSPEGKTLVSGDSLNKLKIWDLAAGREASAPLAVEPGSGSNLADVHWGTVMGVTSLAFSPDGRTLVSASSDRTITLWDMAKRLKIATLVGHDDAVSSLAFSPDGSFVASGSDDKTVKLWAAASGRLLATLASFSDDVWTVTDPEGRFDTADLEEIKNLHWVLADDPLTPVPLEAFMRDYYEPRLLSRILNGEQFKPVRALTDLNRVQPKVRIVSATRDDKDPEKAIIEVEVAGAQKEYLREGGKVEVTSAAYDLHLFRAGQLVGSLDGRIVKYGDKPVRQSFAVRLPSAMSGKEISFSAYAFNDDRVKSATSRLSYRVPATVAARKGKAYLIHMGVNRSDNPAWDLRYAANDSRLMRQALSAKIGATGAYQSTVALSLIADEGERHADKALLRAVFERLAGREASPLLKELAGAEHLRPATPDDLVLFTFAGHGYADGDGNFYLLTQDTGPGPGRAVNDDLLRRSISSEELSQWLREVDAGDMTLIVDACQSAASVQGKDFKPGPMGSRGLGQLSFDKGMRILAASQADEYALENDKIKQGLLTFALVSNGIDDFAADHAPKDGKILLDEWLRYGVSRVPGLAEEVRTGQVRVSARGGERAVIRISTSGSVKPRPAQQPALFDFAKGRREVEIAR